MEENKAMKTEERSPFLESGETKDEVTFEFDDGKKLYVSQNFLSLASPVFKAMFEHDFEEKKTKTVKLVDKEFDDMLELLKCLHPDIQKPVTFQNVLTVSSIAEEYQCRLIIKRCKDTISAYLQSEIQHAIDIGSHIKKYECALTCLKLLIEADKLKYDLQVKEAVNIITRFNFKYFAGTSTKAQRKKQQSMNYNARQVQPAWVFGTPATASESTPEGCVEDVAKDCKALYESLPEKLKCCLLMNRLYKCDQFDDII